MNICKTGQLNISGVSHNELGTLFFGPENATGNKRMAFCCIRTDNKNTCSILDFRNGISHGSTSKRCGQTDHSRGMSETGTMVDIVGANHRPGKFLNQVILFIGNFG